MKKILLPIIFLAIPMLAFAQGRTLTGIVKSFSDKSALPGVNVIIKGTSLGTVTNLKGEFTIAAPDTTVILEFSYIGYVSQQIKYPKTKNFMEVLLKEDTSSLSEVVVIGYGETRKKSIAASSPAAIKGKAAGVAVHRESVMDAEMSRQVKESPDADPLAKPGVLTAGEIHDFSKWLLWQDIAKKDLNEWQKYWEIKPLERYTVQLITIDNLPVVDAQILLKDETGNIVWTTRSDNTGKGELWKDLFSSTSSEKSYSIEAKVDGRTYVVNKPATFHNGNNLIRVPRYCNTSNQVDIAFVVDATGSMGDEIQYLKEELNDVLGKVKKSLPKSTIHVSSVFYRDNGDEYVTRKSDFSAEVANTVNFIKNQSAGGGGDYPEAVDEALRVAIQELSWSENATTRLLFLVLDAPPHYNRQVMENMHRLIQQAAAKGIRIIPVTASGIDKSTEYLMRAMALATNGTYVFLTDDSGVGNSHIKPTTDTYEVELLNDLFIRLITKFTQSPDCSKAAQWHTGMAGADTPFRKVNNIPSVDSLGVKPSGQAQNSSVNWLYYPNPATDIITIELEKEVKEIFITDITGKVILRKIPSGNRTEINLRTYPSGIYFVKFDNGKKWETGKFILNRT